jgi:hypothetical protein
VTDGWCYDKCAIAMHITIGINILTEPNGIKILRFDGIDNRRVLLGSCVVSVLDVHSLYRTITCANMLRVVGERRVERGGTTRRR